MVVKIAFEDLNGIKEMWKLYWEIYEKIEWKMNSMALVNPVKN